MENPNDYVGIPWQLGGYTKSAADCWGLTVMVCKYCYGVNIKIYLGSQASGDDLAGIIVTEIGSDSWQLVESPRPGDVCIMRNETENHIGVYVGSNAVIHSFGKDQKGASAITRTRALERVFNPLEYYRYVGNNSHAA